MAELTPAIIKLAMVMGWSLEYALQVDEAFTECLDEVLEVTHGMTEAEWYAYRDSLKEEHGRAVKTGADQADS
ncbi:hypothetical protein SEA_TORITOKI_75 [Streptomyces phage ToriToki]|uniref:Uncharacterized protein n=2 Tax=Immanueltrevirus immanuel3 TaxID=2846399 RepID=A0A2H5BML3_9CAUD|nr:hypothetical protein SEA_PERCASTROPHE_75 [Streptomyces phage Percastrophe]AUG87570.1 hypothetical protein SEA_TORITOKI_75 [Streptomyces phage ToriToki]